MQLDVSDILLLAERALKIMIEVAGLAFEKNVSVMMKGQGNFVTSADLEIERKLKRKLSRLSSKIGFITEESVPEEQSGYNWIIDPIDGTTNFLNGFPFAISLALTNGTEGGIVFGAVYNPVEKLLYYAVKNHGSYCVDGAGEKREIHVGEFFNNEGIAIFGMPYNREKTDKILRLAAEYYKISSDLKRIGPASLDICRVASGQAKLYFELDLNIWDIAAGILILEEAGGHYEKKDDLFVFFGGNVRPESITDAPYPAMGNNAFTSGYSKKY